MKGKKKLLLAVSAAVMLCSACMPTEISDGDEKGKNDRTTENEPANEQYVKLSEIDWSKEHLECKVSEKLSISADIVPDTVYKGKQFGLYHYTENKDEEWDSEEQREQYMDEFKEKIEAYYEQQGNAKEVNLKLTDLTCSMHKNLKAWSYIPIYNDALSYTDMLDIFYPIKANVYDGEKISQPADEFMEAFSEYIDDGIFGDYEYDITVFSDEFYEKWSKFEAEMNNAPIDDYVDAYCQVNIRKKMDNGIYYKLIYPVGIGTENVIGLALDENYNVIKFVARQEVDIDETPFKTVEIMSLESIVEKLQEKFKTKETLIRSIRLNYALPSTCEEVSEEDLCVMPLWDIALTTEKSPHVDVDMVRCIYSAVDGKLLYCTLD